MSKGWDEMDELGRTNRNWWFTKEECPDIPDARLVRISLIVTNIHRGIYMGEFDTVMGQNGKPVLPRSAEIELINPRHCRFYGDLEGAEHIGYFSLATKGPATNSLIGPPAPDGIIRNAQNILRCTREAIEAFKRQGWGQTLHE